MAEHHAVPRRGGAVRRLAYGPGDLHGADAAAALERLVPGDITGLKPGRQRYTLLMNEAGGIIDDLMVANHGDRLLLIVNASRKAGGLPRISRERLGDRPSGRAARGPRAARAAGPEGGGGDGAPRAGGGRAAASWRSPDAPSPACPAGCRAPAIPARTGSRSRCPASRPRRFAERLLAEPEVSPPGSARATACGWKPGLPLRQRYRRAHHAGRGRARPGRSPSAAARPGIFRARRRCATSSSNGPHRIRVGIRPEGRAPARAGTLIVAEDGTGAGTITSGGFGPSVNAPIAMGYVRRDLAADGHRALPDGARQAASGASSRRCPSSPTATPAEGFAPVPDLTFTKDHEWVRLDGNHATVGITDHAQEALGDIVFVELPELGRDGRRGRGLRGGGKREGGVRRLRAAAGQGDGGQRGDRRRSRAGQQRSGGRGLVLQARARGRDRSFAR